MKIKDFPYLKELLNTPGPSGFEQEVQKLFRAFAEDHCDDVKTDVHGNVVAFKKGTLNKKIMLTAHIDEIGFMVKHIDDHGCIRFDSIGGVDASLLPGLAVRIYNASGAFDGIIGKKPIHLMDQDERKKVVRMDDLWIDIGAGSAEAAKKMVSVGDYITFNPSVTELPGELLASKSLDDRVGVFVLSSVLRELSGAKDLPDIYVVSSVQEEVGLRGAVTSAYNIRPDIGIAVDVTHASDYPSIDKNKHGDVRLGEGCVFHVGANINSRVLGLLKNTAKETGISYQLEAAPRNTGTEANAVQLSRGGVATGLVSIPLRYMHSPNEIVSLKDTESAIRVIAAFCKSIDVNTDLIP